MLLTLDRLSGDCLHIPIVLTPQASTMIRYMSARSLCNVSPSSVHRQLQSSFYKIKDIRQRHSLQQHQNDDSF